MTSPPPGAGASRSASVSSSAASVSLWPSRSKNLTPLYSGGLCEAEMTTPRSSRRSATAGVGRMPPRTAAAVHPDAKVVLALETGDLERRDRDRLPDRAREVILERASVDPGRAVARAQDHARDRGLALAGAAVLGDFAHESSSSGRGFWA